MSYYIINIYYIFNRPVKFRFFLMDKGDTKLFLLFLVFKCLSKLSAESIHSFFGELMSMIAKSSWNRDPRALIVGKKKIEVIEF